jgi:hypothetical protein
MARVAIFAGLVSDEAGHPVEVASIGDESYYVVNDAGFLRHIPSEEVDRQILAQLQSQVMANREIMVESILDFTGQDDLFTKAAVSSSIEHMDENIEQLFQVGLPEETRMWMGMMGFRIVIDMHGEVIDMQMASTDTYEGD